MPKDNFSKQASLYAAFRPQYPSDLYTFIYKHVYTFNSAWDCATGNGQVASVLAQKFKSVYATDISQRQLDQANEQPNVVYKVGSAEASGLPEKVDLITVAQAIHWFDIKAFVKEAKRLSHANTLLAFWGYGLFQVGSAIDNLIFDFYDITLGPYWDPERRLIENKYRDIEVPLVEPISKEFVFEDQWSLETLKGYLSSWSAVQHYINKHGSNPVNEFIQQVAPMWGEQQHVSFPIFLRVGKLK
ncbi:MAG: methyltransferase domain-containing protein [Fulvivirga sp.]